MYAFIAVAFAAPAATAVAQSVQCFGRKKTAVAVCMCKRGRGLIKLNGVPLELVQPEILKFKVFEPILLLGSNRFADVDMRLRVRGGGHTSQIYALRQCIAKALIAFYQKYVDETSKNALKQELMQYDRNLLISDPRRKEPKKAGGPGARARYQKVCSACFLCTTLVYPTVVFVAAHSYHEILSVLCAELPLKHTSAVSSGRAAGTQREQLHCCCC